MKHQLLIVLLFSFSLTTVFSQTGKVSGNINNNGEPIPGASITIKGKTTGVISDFDGNYTIECEIGDTLFISSIGSRTKEIIVTPQMFKRGSIIAPKQQRVNLIINNAYKNAIKKRIVVYDSIPNIKNSTRTYNKQGSYIQVNRINEIDIKRNKVNLSFFKPNIFYELGASTQTDFRFVKKNNLPEIQQIYAQGSSINNNSIYRGAETNEIFSYGPRLNSLAFDMSLYPYDTNGRLVPISNNSGKKVMPYENNLFNTVANSTNTFFANVSTDERSFEFDFLNKSGKDIYAEEVNTLNQINLNYNEKNNSDKVILWKAIVKYSNLKNNQPNINGFQNNLLLNTLATPISFSNDQGYRLDNGEQRSFSPANFNNPKWLLHNNDNKMSNELFVASLQNTYNISDRVKLKSKINYLSNDAEQQFLVLKNTVGFINGYASNKNIKKQNLDANINFNWYEYINNSKLNIISNLNFTNEDLAYFFLENTISNSIQNATTLPITNRLHRNQFRWLNKVKYNFLDNNAYVDISNNSYVSSIQNSKWFLPALSLKYEFGNMLYSDWIYKLDLSTSYAKDINPLSLFYNNQSHNSLNIAPENSFSYTANIDLFASKEVSIEDKNSFEASLGFGFKLFNKRWDFDATYYTNTIKGSIFPVLEQNKFELKNIADVRNSGIELNLNSHIYINESFRYNPSIVFSAYKTKTLRLLSNEERIPIAGFSTISKNLIKGQPAGVLVGSAYVRDANNNLILDAEGLPTVATSLKVIGNPIPKFNIGFSNTIEWKRIRLDIVLDYQKGGEVWNGTQNVLNYLGTSQQSANERELGIPIRENRFTRYGFSGVAEDAIVDGSYLNLKKVSLFYDIKTNNERHFIRSLNIGIYGVNLLTLSKFRGATPYNSLFDQSSSQGINYFNTPIISELGVKMNINI